MNTKKIIFSCAVLVLFFADTSEGQITRQPHFTWFMTYGECVNSDYCLTYWCRLWDYDRPFKRAYFTQLEWELLPECWIPVDEPLYIETFDAYQYTGFFWVFEYQRELFTGYFFQNSYNIRLKLFMERDYLDNRTFELIDTSEPLLVYFWE